MTSYQNESEGQFYMQNKYKLMASYTGPAQPIVDMIRKHASTLMMIQSDQYFSPVVEDNTPKAGSMVVTFTDKEVIVEFLNTHRYETVASIVKIFHHTLDFKLTFNHSVPVIPSKETIQDMKENYGKYINLEEIMYMELIIQQKLEPTGDPNIDNIIYWMDDVKLDSTVRMYLKFPIDDLMLLDRVKEIMHRYEFNDRIIVYRKDQTYERIFAKHLLQVYDRVNEAQHA